MENNFILDEYEHGYRIGAEKAKALLADLQQQMVNMTPSERQGFMEALKNAIC